MLDELEKIMKWKKKNKRDARDVFVYNQRCKTHFLLNNINSS